MPLLSRYRHAYLAISAMTDGGSVMWMREARGTSGIRSSGMIRASFDVLVVPGPCSFFLAPLSSLQSRLSLAINVTLVRNFDNGLTT